jgi:hypothetical protein
LESIESTLRFRLYLVYLTDLGKLREKNQSHNSQYHKEKDLHGTGRFSFYSSSHSSCFLFYVTQTMPPTLTERQKEAIVSKVQLHKVTIVVGPTGMFIRML